MAKKKKVSSKKSGGGFGSLLSSLGSPAGTPKTKQKQLDISEYVPELPSVSGSALVRGLGVLVLLLAVLQCFALFGSGGYLGTVFQNSLVHVFGVLGYLSPLLLVYAGVHLMLQRLPSISLPKLAYGSLLLLTFTALPNLYSRTDSIEYGGLLGNLMATSFETLFSYYPALIFITLLFVYSITGLLGIKLSAENLMSIKDRFTFPDFTAFRLPQLPFISRRTTQYDEEDESEELADDASAQDIRDQILGTNKKRTRKLEVVDQDIDGEVTVEQSAPIRQKRATESEVPATAPSRKSSNKESEILRTFVPPPLSLLQRDSGKASVGDTKANMSVIKRTLADFGIQVEMDEVSIGPSVTRYTLKPAQGVKLSRIANHRQELAYALRAESVRIEAPIPGKALVGIEIPNESKSMVGLASLLAVPGWDVPDKPLLVALGKGISGTPLFSNLAKMPHLLIAGTTGSGKSVMVHTIINSLLFRNSPQDLKFIMVDPKKVELTLYNNIPHLYTPVITNPKVTIRTLGWAVNEMERRYDVLEENGVRDIATYHKDIYQKALRNRKNEDDKVPGRMPYIVIIIDELADIMMSYPKELESAIVRLAQKSRAVGIHLILSTQRPSVNVITGLIKANIPSRIALKVASQIDSRTIIDTAGAEQLLGQGDLLFTSSESPKQERVQSPFVSDGEVKRVVEYLKNTYRDMVPEEINVDENTSNDRGMQALFGTDLGSVGGGDTDDDLFEEARDIVISSRKASTSYLQRRLKIGYSRAARLMDMLEERGIIGAGDGAKPREVLVGSPVTSELDSEDEE
jgi:DNA segregation ATPase FtsK/SpoIIIE, S-DNA-T family